MPYNMMDDEANLIHEAQRGVPEAVEMIISAHQPLLHALSRRFFISETDRQELVQAGNLGLMQALIRYTPQRGCRLITYAVPWVLGEMRRTLRKLNDRHIPLESQDAEDGVSLIDTLQGNAGIDIDHLDLRIALQKLGEEEQRVICLRYYRSLSQKEAALLLGKSQTQISRIERRALDALNAYLA